MKVIAQLLSVAIVVVGVVFLWLGSGWLTVPLNEEGA